MGHTLNQLDIMPSCAYKLHCTTILVGYPRMSPVTGQPELYYPVSRKALRLVVGALATVVLVLTAIGLMVLVLNLQGIILPNHRWLYIPQLARFTRPGMTYKQRLGLTCLTATFAQFSSPMQRAGCNEL